MKTVKGDLLKLAEQGEFDVIIHGCNCFHAMGSGIAGQIAQLYPGVPKIDRDMTKFGDKTKLGHYTWLPIYEDNDSQEKFIIINAYTQYKAGTDRRHASYDAIADVFGRIADTFHRDTKIGYPLIGAGLAGGDWDVIKVIIEKALVNHDHTLVEYNPSA